MSYFNLLVEKDKLSYQHITDWNTYYQDFKSEFSIQHPNTDFSQAVLVVENKVFTNDVYFTGNFECAIEFINCYFLREVVFYIVEVKKSLMCRQCFCDQELRIMKTSTFKDDFNISDFSAKRQVYVEGGSFQDCKWSFIDNGIVKINGGSFKYLNLGYWGGGCLLKELSFHFPNITGLIKVTGDRAVIEHLSLFQFSTDLTMAIEDISVNSLSIYRFRNDKAFRIFNLKSKKGKEATELAISESYLGKAEFYSVDLTAFDNVYLTDVHLIDCSFVNVIWKYDIESFKGRRVGKSQKEEQMPSKIAKLKTDTYQDVEEIELLKKDPDVIEYYSKNREVFRQLKFANGKQGDIINEQKFHSREMLAYNRTLDFSQDFWTKLIIKMSYWFSDFGQSFIRPILWLLFIHLILLLILIQTDQFSNLSISLSQANESGFQLAFSQYFKLMNPLRRAENTFDGYRIVVDIMMRIWSSYMIYNIIRATRRFIK
jgi:hypothetical protein